MTHLCAGVLGRDATANDDVFPRGALRAVGAWVAIAVTLAACGGSGQQTSPPPAAGSIAPADTGAASAPPPPASTSPLPGDVSRGVSGASGAAQAPPSAGAPAASAPPASGSDGSAANAGASSEQRLAAATRALAAGSPAPDAPATTRTREVTIPAGTTLRVKLSSEVASDSSQVEDVVRGTLDAPISIGGEVVVPPGAAVRGSVVSVQRAGKVKGRASVALRFDRLSAHGEDYDVRTDRISRQAQATKKEDAKKIGIGAGVGAAIGAIAGGGKGAAIGSAVGAGAGTGAVVATRGDEVRLAAGTVVTTKVREPITVVVGR